LLAHLDLNLLRVFDALRLECSVSNAARRLRITQPGASRALARLREAFDDPLFIPAHSRLVLTPYAERIAEGVSAALELLAACVAQSDFNPKQSERRFTISMSDYGAALLLPALCRYLETEAPGIRVEVKGCSTDAQQALADGVIDLSIQIGTPEMRSMHIRKLLRDEFVAVARPDHPAFSLRTLSCPAQGKVADFIVAPETFLSRPASQHIASPSICGSPSVQTENVLASALLAAQSDSLVMLPRLLALRLERYAMLRILPLAFDLGGFDLSMHWHERFQADAGHHWLRDVIHSVALDVKAAEHRSDNTVSRRHDGSK